MMVRKQNWRLITEVFTTLSHISLYDLVALADTVNFFMSMATPKIA